VFVSLNIKSFCNLLFFARIYPRWRIHDLSSSLVYRVFHEIMKQNEVDALEQHFFFVTNYIFYSFFFHRYYIRIVEAERRTLGKVFTRIFRYRVHERYSMIPGSRKVMKRYFFATRPPETLFVNVGSPW